MPSLQWEGFTLRCDACRSYARVVVGIGDEGELVTIHCRKCGAHEALRPDDEWDDDYLLQVFARSKGVK